MTESCPTLVHLVALRRRDGGLPNPGKTSDLRFHMTPEDAALHHEALPEEARASFGVYDATLTVVGEHGAPVARDEATAPDAGVALEALRDLYRRKDGRMRSCRHHPDEDCVRYACFEHGCKRAKDILSDTTTRSGR